jgi:CDP-glucose 4,6-dehydratase
VINLDLKNLSNLEGPILVTGHTGFKGTWLTFLLEELGLSVIGISKEPLKESLYELANRKAKIPEIYSDLCEIDNVENFLRDHKPSVIFHLAAQALVLESYKNPLETFKTNVMGTVNILDIAYRTDFVKSIVISTTDKVYENLDTGKLFVETDALKGKDPYSASKVGTEAVITAWQQIRRIHGGPQITAVRAGNVIGGGDLAENRLMPDIARGLKKGTKVEIRNSASTRPWQHVLDPLVGYVLVSESHFMDKEIDSINFGPTEKSISVKEVCDIVSKITDDKINFQFSEIKTNDMSQQESILLDLDSTKAQKELGWRPNWSQREAIEVTIKWWQEVLDNSVDPRAACLGDIRKLLA